MPIFPCSGSPYALNEFTLRKKIVAAIRIHTYLNGEFLNTYWADGLIVATLHRLHRLLLLQWPGGVSRQRQFCDHAGIAPQPQTYAPLWCPTTTSFLLKWKEELTAFMYTSTAAGNWCQGKFSWPYVKKVS